MARMKDFYVKEVAPALMKKFGYQSVMQIPKLEKIVINVGCGEARDNHKVIEAIISDLSTITGQRPVDQNHTVVYEIEELPYPVITSLSAGEPADGMEVRLSP